MNRRALQVARYILGLSWIYHGLFPKLVTVAPLEKALTSALGFSDSISLLVIRAAGISEIVFGILLILFYKSRFLLMLSIFGLCLLGGVVVAQMPSLLLAAFNPITTNFALIGLSYVLLAHART